MIDTLHTYFVVLDRDGRLQISGVPAGDYDLALRLYEPPGDGCLVSPVGSRIVRFQVTDEAAQRPTLDLGDIPIVVATGSRIGDVAPDFTAATLAGGRCSSAACEADTSCSTSGPVGASRALPIYRRYAGFTTRSGPTTA